MDGSEGPAEGAPAAAPAISISQGERGDAEALLHLQRLCYQCEAMLYGDRTIPPLTQTLASLSDEFDTSRVLIARLGAEIVGSVRGRLEGDTCHVGRLVVHPRVRRRGLGGRLMAEIEAEFAGASRFELFTGHLSKSNLRLYRRLGYVDARTVTVSPRLTLVYLQKPGTADSSDPETG